MSRTRKLEDNISNFMIENRLPLQKGFIPILQRPSGSIKIYEKLKFFDYIRLDTLKR